MQTLQAVRRKIRAVRNIQKITQAMKMVAAARLRRVQDKVLSGRPYSQKMRDMVEILAPHLQAIEHPLLQKREVKAVGLVVVTGDKGLCGSYNNNVIRAAQAFMEQNGKLPTLLFCIGRKGGDFFSRRNYNLHQRINQIAIATPFAEVRRIANDIVGWFTGGVVDEVHIAYTEFISIGTQRPKVVKFLPIEPEAVPEEERRRELDFIFEPKPQELLAILLPRYVENQIYQILLEALASEFAARMNAMTLASDNCSKMLDELTLQANKARQWAITKELLEITTAAEALKKMAS